MPSNKISRQPVDNLVRDQAEALAKTGMGPTAIFKELKADPTYSQFTFSQSFIDRIVQKTPVTNTPEETIYWSLLEGDGEDARHVLEARYPLILRSKRQVRRAEQWATVPLASLLKAVPDFPIDIAWTFARIYALELRSGRDMAAWDDYLACGPWRSKDKYHIYLMVVELGRIRPIPLWEIFVEQQNPNLSVQERQDRIERWEHQEDTTWQA